MGAAFAFMQGGIPGLRTAMLVGATVQLAGSLVVWTSTQAAARNPTK
jgi:hypothetical protein